MNNKRVAVLFFTCFFCIVLPSTNAKAANNVESPTAIESNFSLNELLSTTSSQEYESYLEKYQPSSTNTATMIDEEILYEWKSLVDSNTVHVNTIDNSIECDVETSDELSKIMYFWNIALADNLLTVDENTFTFSTPDISMATINQIENNDNELFSLERSTNRAAHCGQPVLDAVYCARINYNTINDYYNSMIYASYLNPGSVNPWMNACSFWISKIRPGGEWDYKAFWGYAYEFCVIYKGTPNIHVTAEQLGNYNYGFTGRILFPLDMLYAGSAVVSGMPDVDKETDWPWIKLGYNDAA